MMRRIALGLGLAPALALALALAAPAPAFADITASGSNKYKVALRTITREQEMLFKRSTGSDRVKLHEYVDVAYTESAVQSPQPDSSRSHGFTGDVLP